jgi:hypothetical protein
MVVRPSATSTWKVFRLNARSIASGALPDAHVFAVPLFALRKIARPRGQIKILDKFHEDLVQQLFHSFCKTNESVEIAPILGTSLQRWLKPFFNYGVLFASNCVCFLDIIKLG